MTYNQANKILKNLTEDQLNEYGVLISKLHTKINTSDKPTAEALEVALQALSTFVK